MYNTKPPATEEPDTIRLLAEVSRALNHEEDINKVLRQVLSIMSEHMDMMRGMITILNRDTDEIVINESFGLSEEEQARGRYKPGEGIIGKVVKTGRHIAVPRIDEEPMFLDRTGSRNRLKTNHLCFVCVPLRSGNEVIGTLSADRAVCVEKNQTKTRKNKHLKDTTEELVDLLSIIASMISRTVRIKQIAQEESGAIPDAETSRIFSFYREESHLIEDEQYSTVARPANIIGNSKAMLSVFRMIDKIAPTNATALILGESGVGKELVASAIHFKSHRPDKAFIKFNCAALPESIVESELFGHEKGAFTGATSTRQGRFELADGGTVFLDEIGELSLAVQAKLLRILQEKEFERVGGSKTLKTDIRVIAATNRDLEEEIANGKFREDLYYRLNIFPITVPALRERKSDILLLADYFVEKYNAINFKGVRRISTRAIDMLMRYHWPGNVRELENCIERAVILSEDSVIHGYHLPPTLQTAESSGTPATGSLQQRLDAIEHEMIIEALKRTKGNMSKAARELGLSERVMGLRVKKFGIDFRKYRP
ncbi:sigma 54-interacting transcriptional regulator [Prosthecochloris sp. HL-130-GSB]|jgi:Nif-specific regulatory protein|uniref:sigma 54-interacting transcriptional regulator n=1 Tax=Prosthecochloris sp. HL-130-GSB TaxID=1974213 RepID=UPI000A1C0682|nr:sigma 54-interacting transcriptional regulator [Prosthecochloris sp. HL-130-GSB]ARM30575.1 sigma-54-dependent Fis family transcriptional regulator [Prosthecochloris sp. HL-130-GSB]MBO8093274.1 sigma 54-interacting transcriptional regulator [Prosthecochloris sp.]